MRLRTLPLLLALVGCPRAPAGPPVAGSRPRLAVVLVVDQMRADYLERFGDLYRGGLARLRRDGAVFRDAHVRHARTFTAPGHASASTGTHPARHGVVANEWYDRTTGAVVYAADDPRVAATLTGPPTSPPPGRSPRQLQRLALGDWLKAERPQAKVYSVALKDRAAVMLGGQRPDRAYWYYPEQPGFGSSTWYADGAPPPPWVATFNASGALYTRFLRGWVRSRDPSAYLRAGPDRVDAEADGVHTEFPHAFDDGTPAGRAAFAKEILYTPFGDEYALAFARALVAAERLGDDDVPDLLLVSCSSADYVGHRYGPLSHEVEDYYLRLDESLGEFLTFLDEHVGKDRYVLALTADHGALPLPEEAALRGVADARRVLEADYRAQVDAAVAAALARLGAPPEVRRHTDEDGVWLDAAAAEAAGVAPPALRAAVADALRGLDFVADALTADDLSSGTGDRPYLDVYRRSFYPARSPDVQLRFREWQLVAAEPRGTSHGSPYAYDTHVPVLLFGAGVRAGAHDDAVGTVDVAPTLAELLGVARPAELDGRSLAAKLR
jgi:predicted AlkP superfamily pyrophosphatase or phosphodiesterase